ncbi:MAG: GNAT family N-acetyltransferase [Planctomycetes bacterium]|nr:GNAT family N-acetyltransferase [Planctomycetota bacterium]
MSGSGPYRAEVDRVSRREWSAQIGLFDDASLYQAWDYVSTLFPKERPSRIVVRDGDDVSALAQIRIRTTPFLPRGIAYVAWGPLWRPKGRTGDPEAFAASLALLKDEYATRRKLLLRVVPNVTESDGAAVADALEAAGFVRTQAARPYRTSLVDISRPLNEIRKAFAQKWRNCLNGAERSGLEVTVGTSAVQYAEFLSIYHELLARKHFETNVDADRWALLQESLPEAEKMRIVLGYHGGEAVAAVVISGIGRRGIYLLGASRAEGLKIKASYLLQWRAIEWLKENGCRVYDLGGVDAEGNPGVYRFKARMGGEEVSHIGVFEYCQSSLSRLVVRCAEAFRPLKKTLLGGGRK